MHRRLYGCLDLDDTHTHIVKKIALSDKSLLTLLNIMLKKNLTPQATHQSYSHLYIQNTARTQPNVNPTTNLNANSKRMAPSRKLLDLNTGRPRLNLMRQGRMKSLSRIQKSVEEPMVCMMHKRTERRELPISKFDLSNCVEGQEEDRLIGFFSENSQKENQERPGQFKYRFFTSKNDGPPPNLQRYSALLRPLNLDRPYQPRLPEIPLSRKLQHFYGKGMLKRVQFA